ncbi:hypothetical protein MHB50_11840 [Siminovitchia sp. FSL H7-0308]|uniref:Uncharacterized protein n=1 Tax=Siminovitchia thermophila TaxID=1245522 RepID=A0ABS2R5Z3_9BACI|nr:hypothetical protein [Siminovitchia thermophila]MBM7715072.1 hypothetical protein [Siminovitchia thermophila]ONK22844.1 hypothetical protein BLX87_14100 [Bacillus sp. VT-16-64]
MNIVKGLAIVIGICLLFGMLHHMMACMRPRIYPPKKVLKQRAALLGFTGLVMIIIALLL